ncbi:MAG: hypothetical protein ACI841_003425 [Planctomycetota bacterium]|jgi:hypothetical protein
MSASSLIIPSMSCSAILRLLLPIFLAPLCFAQAPRVPQEAINAAVDRGVTWLLAQQRRDGSWGENDHALGSHRDPRSDLTAFCSYVLLKSKVPYEHPSIQRALTFLESGWPTTVYSISNQILLLAECDNPRWKKRLPDLVDFLLDLRHGSHGTWGYPGHPSIETDLSNTQYATLALRAANRAGLKIPRKVWPEIVERVLLHQEPPQDSKLAASTDKRKKKKPQLLRKAAFSYLLPNPSSPSFGYTAPSASMTTAGLAILRIAETESGSKLTPRLLRRVKLAAEYSFQWLQENWSVKENLFGPKAWTYYYLYGLQRIGALYEVETIGGHDWYQEGAAELIKQQYDDGHWQEGQYMQWPRQPLQHGNTGYALLFLVKAMAPVSGGPSRRHGSYAAEDPRDEVMFRAAIRSNVSAWVTGFGDGVVAANTIQTPDSEGMFVEEVRYYLDDEVVSVVAATNTKPWTDNRFASQLPQVRNGTFDLRVGVVVRSDSAPNGQVELESDTVAIEISGILEPWMLAHARFSEENLLADNPPTIEASSANGEHTSADRAIDGLASTRWLSSANDSRPKLTLTFKRSVKANTLVLCQADSNPAELGRHSRVTRVSLRVNGSKHATEATLDGDTLRPQSIEFPKTTKLRRLEIEILEFEPGDKLPDLVGFSEVGLAYRR